MAEKGKKKKTKKIPARRKKELEQRHNIEKKSAIATGLIFLMLFISFIFIALKSPVPEPRQKGIDVILGEHNLGMNQQFKNVKKPTEKKGQAKKPQNKKAEKAEETKTSESPKTKVENPAKQESETQDKVPAPKLKDKAKKKKKEKAEKTGERKGDKPKDKENKQKEQKQVKEKNLFTPGQSKGDKDQVGNQGKEKGKKDSKSFEKKGEAVEGDNPISNLNLEGRSVTDLPKIDKETQKEGKVVVEITVNKDGEVIKAVPGKRGTTITSLRLKKIAKKAALNTKFDKIKDGPSRQVGTMTINFKLQ